MNLEYLNLFTFVHFILWFTIGTLYPNQYFVVFVLSIIWEVVEGYGARNPILHSMLKKYWFVPEKYWNEGIGNKIIDVVVNLIGYYIASRLVNKIQRSKTLFFMGLIIWGATLMNLMNNNKI